MKNSSLLPQSVPSLPPRLNARLRFILLASFGLHLSLGSLAQAQRLTEFLAANTSGITDVDGTRQPWIEIWNPSATAVVTLTNFKLSNGIDPVWTFPTGFQIMPDERVIIWASGKNRITITAPLHTSFTLPTVAGSTLSLLNASNTIVSSLSTYPTQVADVSWGRDDSDTAVTPTLTGPYVTPTPGEKNNTYTGASVAGEVVFSQPSRAFNTSDADATIDLTITQTVPDPAAEIRYTTSFPNLGASRYQHTATRLTNGKIVVAGGLGSSTLATGELFDPVTTSWSSTGNLAARRLHTATLLPDGKVLVAGGISTAALNTAQLYDPNSNTWAPATPLAGARQLHSATLLNDGNVLVVGGLATAVLSSVERYDAAANIWTAAPPLTTARRSHTATLLPDGKLLIVGGMGAAVLNSCEIYDPLSNTWSAGGNLISARQEHTATLLNDGKVLVTGGIAASSLATTELYDPALNTWSTAAPLSVARRLHAAATLPDGRVLVTGGIGSVSLATGQIYNPALNTWAAAPTLTNARHQFTIIQMADGGVMVTGGNNTMVSPNLIQATSEIYRPATNLWTASPRPADLPGLGSPLYSGPIPVNATTMIRARVFKSGFLPGATAACGLLRLETNSRSFNSAMPIAVISNFAGSTPPADGDQGAFMWVWDPAAPDGRARFTNPPVIANRIVIDRRGSSTLDNPKFSLNVETRTPFDEDEQDVSLMGMPSHSDWVFHAPYSFDPSLLHNPLAYAMSNAVGRYAVRNRMAEVFVDITGSGLNFAGNATGDYFGVYNVMEKIRRGSERVDIARLDTYDNDLTGKTGGYIYKVDRLDPGDNGFSAGGQSLAYYYPKERDLKSAQRDPQEQFLTTFINQFNTRLQSASYTDPVLGYATHLDVPAAVDHHLVNVWTFNVDALRLSGYWTKDRNGKMFPGPVWDFDRALSSTDGRDSNPSVWRSQTPDLGTDFFNYSWWSRLFRDANFYQNYIDRWQELRVTSLSRVNLEAMIDSLNAQISAEAVTRDRARWNQSKRAWTRPFPPPNNNTIAASQAAEVQRLKDYLQQRANFMDGQWVGPVTASVPSGFVTAGTTVTLTGPAGVPIYYTLDGSDPRPSGGAAPGVGPQVYAAPVPITMNSRLRARAYKATHTALIGANNPPLVSKWGGPADMTYTTDSPAAPGDVILSEINFNPADPTPAELAINPAWTGSDFEFLEIRNISGRLINLTGANFTRGITFAFTGAAARSMLPGESVVIASNPVAFAARYGSALTVSGPWVGNLSNGGENITLVSAGSPVLFSVDYLDSWIPEADNGGYTMVAYEYYPFDSSAAPAWRRSNSLGGSAGAWDSASLPLSAGPDVSAAISATPELRGEIAGATSPGSPVLAWTQVSGPGTMAFANPALAVTTVSADLPGTYRVRLTLTVNGITSQDETTVFLTDTPTAWLARNPGIGSLTDDPDADGRNNFLEFALLTNPAVPDGSQPPGAGVSANHLTLTYQRHKSDSGVSYAVEISDSLPAFRLPNPGELIESILEDTGTTQKVLVTDSALLGTPVKRLLRIKASSP